MRLLPLALCLTAAAPTSAQIVSDPFDSANTDGWGLEFGTPAPHMATGGNPGGRIEVDVQSANSNLPAAMVVPSNPAHPWQGNFRALGVTGFRFDRQVEVGASNFGTRPNVVLANDAGTPTDFSDDTWCFIDTGDVFQFGPSPWTTIQVAIDSGSTTLPTNWNAEALPGSPNAGLSADALWDAVIQDVSYVGISMARPWNGGSWFGAHIISFDNFVLEGGGLGTSFCSPAPLNAAGLSGRMGAMGSLAVSDNDLTLTASDLPAGEFGIFVVSRTSTVGMPGQVSNGRLCLSGSIGRFNRPGQILGTGSAGAFSLAVNLNEFPQGPGLIPVLAGETWNFQAWHREPVGLGSNLTDGLELSFQ